MKFGAYDKLCLTFVLIYVTLAGEPVVAKNPRPWDTVWHLSYHILLSLESLRYNDKLKKEAGQLGELGTECPDWDWDQASRFVACCANHYTIEAHLVCHNIASWSESQLSWHISYQNSNIFLFLEDTLETLNQYVEKTAFHDDDNDDDVDDIDDVNAEDDNDDDGDDLIDSKAR